MDRLGVILWGDVAPLAIMTLAAVVTLVFLWRCHQAQRPAPRPTSERCAADKELDDLAARVDRHLEEERTRRQPRPAGVTAT